MATATQFESMLETLHNIERSVSYSNEATGESIGKVIDALRDISQASLIPQQIEVLKQIHQALVDLKDKAPAGSIDSQIIERLTRVINVNIPNNSNAQILIRGF